MPAYEFRLPSYPSTAFPSLTTAHVGSIARDRTLGGIRMYTGTSTNWTHLGGEVLNVKDPAFGAVGDGVVDDTVAIDAAISAALTGSGGHRPVVFPPGNYLRTSGLTLADNITLLGAGSRPGNQGGSRITFSGTSGLVGGAAESDWSNCHIKGLGFVGSGVTTGSAVHIINPTNTCSVEDVLGAGFPDGAFLVNNGGGVGDPGPNYFRLSRCFGIGGTTPFRITGGRQTVLLEFCGGDADVLTSQIFWLEGGEAQACIRTLMACKAESNGFDVPGFRVTGIAPVLFLGSTYYRVDLNGTAAGFLYNESGQPDAQVELLGCTTYGTSLAVSMPSRNVAIPGNATGGRYIPSIFTGGRGSIFVPYNESLDFNRTLMFHSAVRLGWSNGSTSDSTIPDVVLSRSAANTLALADGNNLAFGTTSGTKIGTSTAQKLGFWNATPIIQPSSYTTAAITTNRAWPTTASISTDAGGAQFTSRADFEAFVQVVHQMYLDLRDMGLLK